MEGKQWYVFYTKARWEKRIFTYLEKFGYEPFLPLVNELHQWSDRKKRVKAPLFRSYIFVFSTPDQHPDILRIPGIAWSIKSDKTPSFLRSEEKESIERVLESGYSVSSEDAIDTSVGETVEVLEGPLKGIKGVVLKSEKDHLLIQIDSLDKSMRVSIPIGLAKTLLE